MAKRPFNFEKMSLSDLAKLRDQIESSLNRRIVAERKDLQMKIDALSTLEGKAPTAVRSGGARPTAARRGTNGTKSHPLKGRKAAAKYRGPNGETWAGRGLMPRWLAALEKKGKKREQFLITRSS
jgi:DNA-binding protein H-NS